MITIAPQSGSTIDLAAATETIDMDLGNKDFETLINLAGGRIKKFTPSEDTTITFEGYFVSIDPSPTNAENLGIQQLFHTTDDNWDETQPLSVDNSRNRDTFNIALLWTNDPSASSADGAVSLGYEGRRFIFANAKMISAKPEYTDGILKTTFEFKLTPFEKNGDSCIRAESTDNSITLDALTSLGATSLGGI